MDERTKELIAIGASITAHCQPCLTWHVEKALELGIDHADICEAIATGQMVEKGSMSAMRKFTAELTERSIPESLSCCAEGKQSDKAYGG